MASTHLTKSRFVAGQQCLRRLWLLVNEPPEHEDPIPGTPLDIGYEIGRKAHLLFPGGVLVDEEPWQHLEAMARTAALMADQSVPAIFEAAFEHVGIRVRVDVLERMTDGSWGLREVKSSGSVKDHHPNDVGIQTFVVKGSGVPLTSVELIHVNTGYVRGPGEIDWPELFSREEMGEIVSALLPDLLDQFPAVRASLHLQEAPQAEPGPQCSSPFDCEFWCQCTADKPADWVAYLPRLGAQRAEKLKAMGIEAISAIPADFPLTWKQSVIRDVMASGKPFLSPDLARLLTGFGPPALYLDFETMNPAIPLYEGTHPYQMIPFQWSLHLVEGDGCLHHCEFLATGDADPRRAFAESLADAIGPAEFPIVVYSAFEQSRLKELAALFPDLRPALDQIIARLADLLPIVRGAIYHPDFEFSNSIKNVAPALCPGFGYDDLDGIADGQTASAAFAQIAAGRIPKGDEVERMRLALLAYCKRDTIAMIEVHRALRALATGAANIQAAPS